jgi:hypothetical protein
MTAREILVEQVTTVRGNTLATLTDLTPEQRLWQPAPGVNHAVWMAGHIAWSLDHLILDYCAGKGQLPEHYGSLFGIGSKLLDNPGGYPTCDELLDRMAAGHEAALAWLRAADEADLDARPMGFEKLDDRRRAMFASRGRCAWFHAQHEAMHAGQLGYLRRLAGKPYRV